MTQSKTTGPVLTEQQEAVATEVFGPKEKRYASQPDAVHHDSRTCFGITWFATEAAADEFAAKVRAAGTTYNGGYFHGMACGRDKGWDIKREGETLFFAVTD